MANQTEKRIHPAILEELDMLRERFPGIVELTLDEYAAYFGIKRHYACQHFQRSNAGRNKINHKRIGRKIIIPMIDFAYWLAKQKIVDGKLLILPTPEQMKQDMKNRRGYHNTEIQLSNSRIRYINKTASPMSGGCFICEKTSLFQGK